MAFRFETANERWQWFSADATIVNMHTKDAWIKGENDAFEGKEQDKEFIDVPDDAENWNYLTTLRDFYQDGYASGFKSRERQLGTHA